MDASGRGSEIRAREDNAQLTSIAIGARGSPLLKCHELLAVGICPHEHNYIRASAMNGLLAENAPSALFRTSLRSVCQPSLLPVAIAFCVMFSACATYGRTKYLHYFDFTFFGSFSPFITQIAARSASRP